MGRINLYARRNVKLETCLIFWPEWFWRNGNPANKKHERDAYVAQSLELNRKEQLESEISTQREPCKLAVTWKSSRSKSNLEF